MKKLLLLLLLFFYSTDKCFISYFSVLENHHHNSRLPKNIILLGDIHNYSKALNKPQCEVIKHLIDVAEPTTLFLFEDPYKLKTENPVVNEIRSSFGWTSKYISSPLFLTDYAEAKNVHVCNINLGQNTALLDIFNILFKDYLDCKTGLSRKYYIMMKNLADLIISTLDKVAIEYQEIKSRLLMEHTNGYLGKLLNSYIQYYDGCALAFEGDRKYAYGLLAINEEIIEHLISGFATEQKMCNESIVAHLLKVDANLSRKFSIFSSSFLRRFTLTCEGLAELNTLREIINGSHFSKIIVIAGHTHCLNLMKILSETGYKRIHTLESTTLETLAILAKSKPTELLNSNISELQPIPFKLISACANKDLNKELFESLIKL